MNLEDFEYLNINVKGSKIFVFPCNRWLARDEDDRAIERDLVATKVIDERIEDGETRSREKDIRDQLESKKFYLETNKKMHFIHIILNLSEKICC